MATSSLFGADDAPAQPSGRSSELLGPSDTSDSGSDVLGTDAARADSDAAGSGERGAVAGTDALDGADIGPDRIVGAQQALAGTYTDPIAAGEDLSEPVDADDEPVDEDDTPL